MRWHVLIACLIAIAGCIGLGDDPTADPAGETVDVEANETRATDGAEVGETSSPNDTAEAPQWEVGEWWTYLFSAEGADREITFVVADASNDTYTLLADDREHAVFDAAFSDLPYIGPIDRTDLRGSQHGEPVRLFDWPLTDGKTWTTAWNFQQRDVEAQAWPVHEVDTKVPGFRMTATSDGSVFAEYTYAPSVGWFTRLDLPRLGISYTLIDHGMDYGGTVLAASSEQVYEAREAPADAAAILVGEEADVLAMEAASGGPVQAQTVQLVAPNGSTHEATLEPCQDCFAIATATVPAEAGDWALARAATDGPDPMPGFAWANVWSVALDPLEPAP